MHVQKFEANSLKEALGKVKQELGPDAIILSTKHHKSPLSLLGKSSLVEVTAAISEDKMKMKKEIVSKLPPETKDKFQNLSAKNQISKFDQLHSLENLKEKIQNQKKMQEVPPQEEPKNYHPIQYPTKTNTAIKNQNQSNLQNSEDHKNLQSISNFLKLKNIHHDLIEEFISVIEADLDSQDLKNIAKIKNYLFNFLGKKIRIGDSLHNQIKNHDQSIHIFIGENGGGKTTTVGKLATIFKLRFNKSIAILSNDTTKIGGIEQIKTIGRIIDVPIFVVKTIEDIIKTIYECKKYELLFIDTAGIFQQSLDYLTYLAEIRRYFPKSHVHMISSISTDLNEIISQSQSMKNIGIDDIIFTKLDAVSNYSNMINFSYLTQIPISYLCNGVEIPHKIEKAQVEKILKYVFKKNSQG